MAQLPTDEQIRERVREKYPDQFSHADCLFEFARTALGEFKGKMETPYRRAIFLMAGKALKSYHAVLTLCEIAHTEDAGVILRSLFNLLVIVRWVSTSDTEQRARKYLGWFWIALNDELGCHGPRIDGGIAKVVRNHYRTHKHLFEYRDPKGTVKTRRKWYEPEVHSLEQMAGEVDLKNHYDGLYRPLSSVEHSDAVAYCGMIPLGTAKVNLSSDLFVSSYLRNVFQYFGEILHTWNRTFKAADESKLAAILQAGIDFFKDDML